MTDSFIQVNPEGPQPASMFPRTTYREGFALASILRLVDCQPCYFPEAAAREGRFGSRQTGMGPYICPKTQTSPDGRGASERLMPNRVTIPYGALQIGIGYGHEQIQRGLNNCRLLCAG